MIARFRSLVVVLLCALAVSSCAERSQLPQKSFEGTITQSIQVPGISDMLSKMSQDSSGAAGANQGLAMLAMASNIKMKMYVRPDKVAYEMSMLGDLMKMRWIIDRNARTLTMLLPNRTAMVRNLRSMDSMREKIDDSIRGHANMFDSLVKLLPQPTGRKQTIEGMEAEEYKATMQGMDVDMWLSDDERVKAFEVVRDAFLGRGHTGMGGLEQVFELMRPIGGKIPVKFETKMNGKTFAKGELKDITEEKVDDEIFQIPKGYEIISGDSAMQSLRRDRAPQPTPSLTAPPPSDTVQ